MGLTTRLDAFLILFGEVRSFLLQRLCSGTVLIRWLSPFHFRAGEGGQCVERTVRTVHVKSNSLERLTRSSLHKIYPALLLLCLP